MPACVQVATRCLPDCWVISATSASALRLLVVRWEYGCVGAPCEERRCRRNPRRYFCDTPLAMTKEARSASAAASRTPSRAGATRHSARVAECKRGSSPPISRLIARASWWWRSPGSRSATTHVASATITPASLGIGHKGQMIRAVSRPETIGLQHARTATGRIGSSPA